MFKMKTSKILLAMALPVAFAACTSEEIVENSNNLNMQNRKVLPAITAYVESGVDSRFSWSEEKFSWNEFTAEDQFAAGLTDATLWTVGDKMMTNYIYSTTGNGYETTSQMVEGTYFFYSYPGFEKVAARQGVPFDLSSQKSVDFKNPTAAVEANQLFISALYKLEEETCNDPIKIGFMSYWSTVGMKIKNTTGDDIKVLRMMIETANDMAIRGELKPSELGAAAEKNADVTGLVYYKDGDNYVLPYKNKDDLTKGRHTIDELRLKSMANTTVKNSLAENTMMLVVENGELADDAEATVYFQMPAGSHEYVKVTFFVEVPTIDDDTEVKMLEAVEFVKNAKSATTVTENDVTELRRHNTIAAFGHEGGKLVAHEITELDVLSAQEAGAYAASYEDLVEIIKTGAERTISNMGDLKIDDAVIKLLASTTALKNGPFDFANEIEITSEKSSDVTLQNFTVSGGAKIVKGKFIATEDLVGALTVEQGTKLTVKASQTGVITNLGTVEVSSLDPINVTIEDGATAENEAVTSLKISVKGDVNVGTFDSTTTFGPAESKITLQNLPNSLTFSAPKVGTTAQPSNVYAHNFTIANGKNVYVGSDVTLKNSSVATKGLIINGYVENKGTIASGTIYGSWDATASAAKSALIENHGVIENLVFGTKDASAVYPATADTDAKKKPYNDIRKAVTNATTVKNMLNTAKVMNPSKSTVTDVNVFGRIDNNEGGFVTTDGGLEVFANITAAQSGKVNISGINTIYAEDITWTDPAVSTNIKYIHMDGVTLDITGTNADRKDNLTAFFADATAVYFENGVANVSMPMTDANIMSIEGSEFKYDLSYNGTSLTDVEVNGLFTTTAASLELTGVTLNKVKATTLEEVTVKGVSTTVGTTTTYTVKTTSFEDVFVDASGDAIEKTLTNLVVEHDAVLNILNDVKLKTTNLTIGNLVGEGSAKGVINQYGDLTVTGTTTNGGTWNK